MNTTTERTHWNSPWTFFATTYIWTWFFWGMAYFLGVSGETGGALGPSLILLGLAGPMISGIAFLYLTRVKKDREDYWTRITDFKRISFAWYLVIFFLMPFVTLISGFLSGHWDSYTFSSLLPSVGLALLVSPLVPIFEELGWRGYVLDRLQEHYSALTSSLIIGIMWACWHIPTFFLKGSVLTMVEIGSLPFWLYFINIILVSVIFTWIYNNTGRSTLSAIILHTVLEILTNFGLWSWFSEKVIYNTVILFFLVAAVVAVWGPKKLAARKSPVK